VNGDPPPRLSLVVPVRASSGATENALSSLCAPYQRIGEPVEILVVETSSSDMLGETRARAHGENIRYFALEAPESARTRSIELGLRESRAPVVGVFMDGAHIVTPRALDTAIRALELCETPLVALPDYRFDESLAAGAGDLERESAWLRGFPWKKDPNELFSVARFGPATPNGFLGPLLGAACLFAPKASFSSLPPFDSRLDVPGAAALKLWLYTELARIRGSRLVVLAGEGAFRQHHGEVELPEVRHEEASMQNLLVSAVLALPGFRAVHREPVVFGPIPGPAQRFVVQSAEIAAYHCAACSKRGEPSWYDDPPET
jgi:hypothetical protein